MSQYYPNNQKYYLTEAKYGVCNHNLPVWERIWAVKTIAKRVGHFCCPRAPNQKNKTNLINLERKNSKTASISLFFTTLVIKIKRFCAQNEMKKKQSLRASRLMGPKYHVN
mgnify:CR=1 FL=1